MEKNIELGRKVAQLLKMDGIGKGFKKVSKRYKKFGIVQTAPNMFKVYTPDEMEQPAAVRQVEWEAGTEQEAKDFIDSY